MKVIKFLIEMIKEMIWWVEKHSFEEISKVWDVERLYIEKVPILSFWEAVNLLWEDDYNQDFNEDLSTENEKALG